MWERRLRLLDGDCGWPCSLLWATMLHPCIPLPQTLTPLAVLGVPPPPKGQTLTHDSAPHDPFPCTPAPGGPGLEAAPTPGDIGVKGALGQDRPGIQRLNAPDLAGCRVPAPCVHAPRVRAALEESAAIHGNALGTDGRVRGRVPAVPSWWTAWSLWGAAAKAGGSRGLRLPLRVLQATRL